MHQHAQPGQPTPAEVFPTDPSGLPEATRPALVELADGDDLHLRIGPVAKRLGDATVRMLGGTAGHRARPGALPGLFAGQARSRPGTGCSRPSRGFLELRNDGGASCPDGPAIL